MKSFVIIGNRYVGGAGVRAGAMVRVDVDPRALPPGQALDDWLMTYAINHHFDLAFGVVMVEAAAFAGGPYGRGPA